MLSIRTQNKDIVYYKPDIQKFYVLEKNRDEKITYEVRASIDNNDCLLGTYADKERARNTILELIRENFVTNAKVLCMPEDK